MLSPTHTKVRILRYEVKTGDAVVEYDPVMVVECSPDLVTEGFRERPDEKQRMIVETQEEGNIIWNNSNVDTTEWISVGTEIGIIDDGDDIDGDWTWQAYFHSDDDDDDTREDGTDKP